MTIKYTLLKSYSKRVYFPITVCVNNVSEFDLRGSYNVHEVLGMIPFLSIGITISWLLLKIVKSIKEKEKNPTGALGCFSLPYVLYKSYL